MLDIRNNLAIAQALPPAARTATANGTSVDLAGYESVALVCECGTVTDGTHLLSLHESNDNSTFTAVAAADLVGAFVNCTANGVQSVGYKGNKRYLRATLTIAGATTGAVVSAVFVRAMPRHIGTAV